jgi:thiol-disulfide isomerase/thioredoxin
MLKRCVLMGVSLFASAAMSVSARPLTIGDPAPRLQVSKFVKGQPVSAFKPGRVYVVEFWATWCGPCVQNIPHLTQLQKKFPNVTFIGVDIWEPDVSKVQPFIRAMKDKMAYRVALDSVPARRLTPAKVLTMDQAQTGVMSQTWMKAAESPGIPTAFIIDGKGRIAWIGVGYTMQMEDPLRQILAGTWDMKQAADKRAQDVADDRKIQKLDARLANAQKAGPKAVVDALNAAFIETPDLESRYAAMKLDALLASNSEEALSYSRYLADTLYPKNGYGLNILAWALVDPAKPRRDSRFNALALDAAERAHTLTKGRVGYIEDTLARAYYVNGKMDPAVKAEENALRLSHDDSPDLLAGMKKALATYKKAAGNPR